MVREDLMRVIGGKNKGRVLLGPKGKDKKIRPALDKVKGAIFEILSQTVGGNPGSLEGKKVLDLFSGTGSIGIEALSRGADECLFVDRSPQAGTLVEKNLLRCGMAEVGRFLRLELPLGLRRIAQLGRRYDVVFVDPPYEERFVNRTLRRIVLEKILAPYGTVIVEHSPREKIAPDVGLTVIDERRYGQTRVSFLRGA